jgi:hypothetical protein
MQSSFFKRTMPKLIFALFALAMGLFISRGDTYAAYPGASTTVTMTSTALNANPDITTFLCIKGPAGVDLTGCLGSGAGEQNFSAVINGTPAASFVAPGPGSPGFQAGIYPALGEVIGSLSSGSTLGLTGNPCLSPVAPTFVFLNGTVDNSKGNSIPAVPQSAANPGSGGTLDNMWSDNGASTTGPGADAPWNGAWTSARATAEGFPSSAGLTAGEQANGLPAQVDRYPYYLNTIFDPDGVSGADPFTGVAPVQPLARYAGAAAVAGTSVVLDLVIFAPGVLANAGFGANHPFTQTSALGYTSIAVLNDPTVAAAHGSISDFCSPLTSTAIINGMARGNDCKNNAADPDCDTPNELSNPASLATTLARYSHPGWGGNQTWNTRLESLRDQDGDGKENSLDACPVTSDAYNARTGGPASEDDDADGLPDACDPNDADGNTDNDGDGWENSYDNCALVSNADQADSELTVAYGTTAPSGGPRGDSIGTACDTDDTVSNGAFLDSTPSDTFMIGAAAGTADSDGDGFTDTVETSVGTSSSIRCGVGGIASDPPSTAWPLDFKHAGIFGSTDKILIDDFNSFLSPRKLDLAPGDPGFDARWDLEPGPGLFGPKWINIADLNKMLGGPTAFPKMFNGARALLGPQCTGQ